MDQSEFLKWRCDLSSELRSDILTILEKDEIDIEDINTIDELDINGYSELDICMIKPLSSITKLSLSDTYLINFSCISKLFQIDDLSIYNCQFHEVDWDIQLTSLTQLTTLALDDVEFKNTHIFKNIATLKSLTFFVDHLSVLPKLGDSLESLYLERSSFRNIDSILEAKNLKYVECFGYFFKKTYIESLKKQCPNIFFNDNSYVIGSPNWLPED